MIRERRPRATNVGAVFSHPADARVCRRGYPGATSPGTREHRAPPPGEEHRHGHPAPRRAAPVLILHEMLAQWLKAAPEAPPRLHALDVSRDPPPAGGDGHTKEAGRGGPPPPGRAPGQGGEFPPLPAP